MQARSRFEVDPTSNRRGLQDEVALLQRDGVIQMYGEVRFPVAVHVAVDVGVGDIPDLTQLALLAAEGGSTGEEKRLIAGDRRVGIDRGKIDPVGFRRKIKDSVASGCCGGRIPERLEHEAVGSTAPVQTVRPRARVNQVVAGLTEDLVVALSAVEPVGTGAAVEHVIARIAVQRVVASITPQHIGGLIAGDRVAGRAALDVFDQRARVATVEQRIEDVSGGKAAVRAAVEPGELVVLKVEALPGLRSTLRAVV